MQFGAKPLFENISVKFGNGNRYGLIGANGCGKSTFMKILGGDLAQTSGTVSIDSDERLGKLRQDQFAFEDYTVLDTVIMGHAELWRGAGNCVCCWRRRCLPTRKSCCWTSRPTTSISTPFAGWKTC